MISSKLESFRSLESRKFNYLKKFSVGKLDTEEDGAICNIEISLTELLKENGHALELVFVGVTDLKVGDLNPWLGSVIDISDISSWGWQATRYKVVDVEADCFSFYCQDFEAYINEIT